MNLEFQGRGFSNICNSDMLYRLRFTLLNFNFNNDIILEWRIEGISKVLYHNYGILHNKFKESVDIPSRAQWEQDLGPLSDDHWTMALSAVPKVLLSTTQKLTQLFILHRLYYTPEKLFKWKRRDSPLCPHCRGGPANVIHMLWRCPKLHRYWQGIIKTINSLSEIKLPLDPGIC